jgi:thiamine biosynthesis lipoprotein
MDARQWRPGRRGFLLSGAAALALPQAGLAGVAGLERTGGTAFATTWEIAAPEGTGLARLRPRIEALLAGIDRHMSPWRDDSEVSAVNRAGAGAHAVSTETATVCAAALAVAAASGGCFDPTVGPLVARWGFGPIGGARTGDWRDLAVAPGRIVKASPGATFDPCGIAKGRALDRMAALLRGAGVEAALVDLGGELIAWGAHPEGRPWRVAVEDAGAGAILSLRDRAVATSGLAHQSYRAGGRLYGHIADPRTGAPASGGLRSVTVAASTAMEADAWATALFAAGAEEGPALARNRGMSALFVAAGEGAPVLTGDMAEMLA